MNVVVSLGGSLLDTDDVAMLRRLGELFAGAADDMGLYVVTGGGATARRYIQAGRALGAPEQQLDVMGIAATRLNARIIAAAMGCSTGIPGSVEEAAGLAPPVVMGGTVPGHSTDAVGAMLAREVAAERFVIATDVDGIYTDDPKRHPDAERYEQISIAELRRLAPDSWRQAGTSSPVDGIACRIIGEASIATAVVNGTSLEMLENAIYGREFYGTRIEV
ncbi:MAG: UMP kinase [Thermoplasmatota archaeon]